MQRKPSKTQIREWLKNDTTKWVLERLGIHINQMDTVRDVQDITEAIGRKKAIEILEGILGEVMTEAQIQRFNEDRKTGIEIINTLTQLQNWD